MRKPLKKLPIDPLRRLGQVHRTGLLVGGLIFAVVGSTVVAPASAQEADATNEAVSSAEISTGWQIDDANSVFAVITHKAGLAAKLAHNHIVTAQDVKADLSFDPAAPGEIQFRFEAPVSELRIDAPADQKRWYDDIAALGLLNEAFSEIDQGKRDDIHKSMTSRKQLDGKNFPSLGGQLAAKPRVDEAQQTFTVELELEIKGEKARRPVEGKYSVEGDRLIIEAAGEFAFTDFGIKPYSAMLGAVKNSDQIHVFLHLEATR